MSQAKRIRQTVIEDATNPVKAYVTKELGAAITRADITSISCTITDMKTNTAVPGFDNCVLDKNVVILDTPVTSATDPTWTLTGGYNFHHILAPAAIPDGDRIYWYDTLITKTDSAVVAVRFELVSDPLARS